MNYTFCSHSCFVSVVKRERTNYRHFEKISLCDLINEFRWACASTVNECYFVSWFPFISRFQATNFQVIYLGAQYMDLRLLGTSSNLRIMRSARWTSRCKCHYPCCLVLSMLVCCWRCIVTSKVFSTKHFTTILQRSTTSDGFTLLLVGCSSVCVVSASRDLPLPSQGSDVRRGY